MKRKIVFALLAVMMILSYAIGTAACGGGTATHEHTFAAEWSKDFAEHWHECLNATCKEKADVAPHSFDEGVVTLEPQGETDGTKTFTCTVCGYAKTETVSGFYTVTFVTNGGGDIAPVQVEKNTLLEKPADPVYDGYRFIGWYKDGAFTTAWDFANDTVTSSMTLYAKTEALFTEREVTFILNYGNTEPEVRSTQEGYITYIPERAGYVFNGWWKSEGSVNGQNVLSEKIDTAERITEDGLILYAEWVQEPTDSAQLLSPTVSMRNGIFYLDPIEGYGDCFVNVRFNGSVVYSSQFSDRFSVPSGFDAGFYILEFYYKGDGVSTINSPIVTKYCPHKILTEARVIGIDYDSNVLAWEPVSNAQSYDLYVDNSLAAENLNSPSFDMTEYDAGGHTIKIVAKAQNFQSSVSLSEVVKYRLRSPETECSVDSENLSYVIAWKAVVGANVYRVSVGSQTFDTGSLSMAIDMSDDYWNGQNEITVTVAAFDRNADYFISAKNEEIVLKKLYRFSADLGRDDAGEIRLSETMERGYIVWGETYTVSVIPAEAYTFIGWKREGEIVSTSTKYDFRCTGDAALSAEWEYYTVTAEKNIAEAGSVTEYNDTAVAVGKRVTLTAQTVSGYQWLGWFIDGECVSTDAEYSFTMREADVVIVAMWEEAPLTAHYVVDGEEVYSEQCSVNKIGLYEYSESGKTFSGWFKDDRLEQRVYSVAESEIADGAVYFYGTAYSGTEGLVFTVYGSGYSVSDYTGEEKEVVIPSVYNNSPVRAISSTALKGKSFTSLLIPESVTSVPEGLLSGCSSIESLTVPFVGANSVTADTKTQYPFGWIFGQDSFSGASKVTQTVTAMNPYSRVYYIPDSLTSVTITAAKHIPATAFKNCLHIAEISLPEGEVTMGGDVFDNSGWYNSQPDGLLIVNDKIVYGYKGVAPENNALAIPAGVKYIVENAFDNCPWLTDISLPFVGSSETASGEEALFGYIFSATSKTGYSNIRMSINSSQAKTFYIPSNLASVKVFGGNLSYGAFSGCYKLTSITLENIGTVAAAAFDGTSITSLVIPESVTRMELNSLRGIPTLKEVTLPFIGTSRDDTNNRYFSYVFGNQDYKNPDVTYVGKIEKVTITGNITSVPRYAFHGCTALKEVVLPGTVTEIGEYAFAYCLAFTSFHISENITEIKAGAFYQSRNIKEFTFAVTEGWKCEGSEYDVTNKTQTVSDLTQKFYTYQRT